jgi:polysaccharide biosynthesis/export protein
MMNWKGWITGLAFAAVGLSWTGCALFGGGNPDKLPVVICQSDVIRVGDMIKVSFHDIPSAPEAGGPSGENNFPVRVDGTINMPLIGSVKAAGKTFGELEAEMQKSYVPKYYTRLTLVIKPGDRFYTVAGEVKAEGRQLYLGETTVLRAISSCSGFTEYANRRKVMIQRADGKTEIVDCRKAINNPKYDRPICPGDHIVVPRSL